jgi:2'-5' RNA ligase
MIDDTSSMSLFVIVYLVDLRDPGYQFERAEWPFHMTIAPPFYYLGTPRSLVEAVTAMTRNYQPFIITIGNKSSLGRNHALPVRLVQSSDYLLQLHGALRTMLVSQSVHYKGIKYPFVPHMTIRGIDKLKIDQVLPVNTLTLVELAPEGVKSQALVKCNVHL